MAAVSHVTAASHSPSLQFLLPLTEPTVLSHSPNHQFPLTHHPHSPIPLTEPTVPPPPSTAFHTLRSSPVRGSNVWTTAPVDTPTNHELRWSATSLRSVPLPREGGVCIYRAVPPRWYSTHCQTHRTCYTQCRQHSR